MWEAKDSVPSITKNQNTKKGVVVAHGGEFNIRDVQTTGRSVQSQSQIHSELPYYKKKKVQEGKGAYEMAAQAWLPEINPWNICKGIR